MLRLSDIITSKITNLFLIEILRNSAKEYLKVDISCSFILLNEISPYDFSKVTQKKFDMAFLKRDFELYFKQHLAI